MNRNTRNRLVRSFCRLEGLSQKIGSPAIQVTHYATTNWGDAINRPLVRMLSGRRVRTLDPHAEPTPTNSRDRYLVVGSTIHLADKHTIVWGTGLMGTSNLMRHSPQNILAVRGPLTREALSKQGIEAPEVYGDPAIFLPKLYGISKTNSNGPVGIVPHYVDKNNPVFSKFQKTDQVRILNIRSSGRKFLADVARCSCVVSTSLHGIIAAESLGIPARWAEVSNKVLGNGFKFSDYYQGSGRESEIQPLLLTGTETHEELKQLSNEHPPAMFDYFNLLQACPFKLSPFGQAALAEYLS